MNFTKQQCDIDFKEDIKARLLQLGPVELVLEKLIEKLPRKLIKISLIPCNCIHLIDERKMAYKSLGNMPTFSLVPSTHFQTGWYYLEAAITRNNGSREAYLLIKSANTREIQQITIPSNLRGSVREVVYLPKGTTNIIWQPTSAPGYFSQSPLLLHKITSLESFLRRIHRICLDTIKLKKQNKKIPEALNYRQIIKNMHEAYACTANIRQTRVKINDYPSFILKYDTHTEIDLQEMKEQLSSFQNQPLISVIIPVHTKENTPAIKKCIDSVLAQLYSNFEIIVAHPNTQSHQEFIHNSHGLPQNIKTHAVDSNHLSSITTCITLATGDYITILDTCEILAPHNLFNIVKTINLNPSVALIYTDHDYLDKNNHRCRPHFKPQWNPDLLLSCDYINSPVFFEKKLIAKLANQAHLEPMAERYDLLLRIRQETNISQINHIAKILTHKDRAEEITTEEHAAQKRALQCSIKHTGAKVENGALSGLFKIQHPIPEKAPLVSILIPTRDGLHVLEKCIKSIMENTQYPNWEIIIIDNNSQETATKSYFQKISQDTRIRVFPCPINFNYSRLNNLAVEIAHGEILVLANNDIEVINSDWLNELVSHATRPGIGAVGAKLLYENGMVQHAGVITGIGGVAGHCHKYIDKNEPGYCNRAVVTQNMTAVTAACLAVKKKIYLDAQGLDEELAVAFNDIDFCLKLIKNGYRNVFTPFALLYHHESISRGPDDTPEKQKIFKYEFTYMQKKWGEILSNDIAYNPNLTDEFENFGLR